MIIFVYISTFLMPILGILFCLNLVSILKKIKEDVPIGWNTFWLTVSFVLIVWSIAVTALIAGGQ